MTRNVSIKKIADKSSLKRSFIKTKASRMGITTIEAIAITSFAVFKAGKEFTIIIILISSIL